MRAALSLLLASPGFGYMKNVLNSGNEIMKQAGCGLSTTY